MHLREGRQLQQQNKVFFCHTVSKQVLHLRVLKSLRDTLENTRTRSISSSGGLAHGREDI